MHEWRKRVKDLWYHCLLLQDAWKPVMSALADEAHELSDRLGDDHDLAVLLEWAHVHGSALDGSRPAAARLRRDRREPSPGAAGGGVRIRRAAVRRQAERLRRSRIEGWWDALAPAPR